MIKDLPGEILQTIFSYLAQDYLLKLRYVCRQWYTSIQIDTVILNPTEQDSLLADFYKNPTFSLGIKQLVLKDKEYTQDTPLKTLLQRCPNVCRVRLEINNKTRLVDYLDQLNNKLETLQLYLSHDSISCSMSVDMDLVKIIKNCQLRKLIVTGGREDQDFWLLSNWPIRKQPSWTLSFFCSANEEIYRVQVIEIENNLFLMNGDCIEFFMSGQLKHLKVLKLHVKMKESCRWDKLKEFCETSLEKYDIFIQYGLNREFFIINNKQ